MIELGDTITASRQYKYVINFKLFQKNKRGNITFLE